MQDLGFQQISIVGVGLLGGSIGLALRAAGFTGRIIGIGRRATALRRAEEIGCIDRGVTDLTNGVAGSDLILLCAPIGAIHQLLERLETAGSDGAVITDVGSTKGSIAKAADRTLSDAGRFIGSHPMAGGERCGPEAARADLLTNKPVILTPTGSTRPETLRGIEGFWRTLGMRVIRMSPERHDRLVARISHLPHAVAALIVELGRENGSLDLASTGFADTTRVAAGDPGLWADIFLDNRDAMLDTLDEWTAQADHFRNLIADGRRDELLKLLKSAQQTREEWGRSKGPLGD